MSEVDIANETVHEDQPAEIKTDTSTENESIVNNQDSDKTGEHCFCS